MRNTKNKKIKVMQFICSLTLGGAETLLLDVLENFDNKNIEFITVILNDKTDITLKNKLLKVCPDSYFLNRKEGSKNPKYFFELLKIIKKHKIQVIHSHDYGSKLFSILFKLLNPNLKLIYTVHNMHIMNKITGWKYFLHKNFIDLNIAISEAVKTHCQNHKINKVKRIYNSIKVNKFINNTKKSENDIYKIINVSRIDHLVKGQDILIKALKICKDRGCQFECEFVGDIEDKKYSGSYKYLKDLKQ